MAGVLVSYFEDFDGQCDGLCVKPCLTRTEADGRAHAVMLQWLSYAHADPAAVTGITEVPHEGVITASFGHYPAELYMWAAWVPAADLPDKGFQFTERMVDKEGWVELFSGKRPVPAHYVAVFAVDSDADEEGSDTDKESESYKESDTDKEEEESDTDKEEEESDKEELAPAAKKARGALADEGKIPQ